MPKKRPPIPPPKPPSEPKWEQLTPLRQEGSGILGDIKGQLWAGHPYADTDPITYAHEGTHGINGRIREQWKQPGFYCLRGKVALTEEPACTLRDVAQAVPAGDRGRGYAKLEAAPIEEPRYGLYLVGQQRWWNNEPSYILDELSAYINGVECGLELGAPLMGRLESAEEMLRYARVMDGLVEMSEQMLLLLEYQERRIEKAKEMMCSMQ